MKLAAFLASLSLLACSSADDPGTSLTVIVQGQAGAGDTGGNAGQAGAGASAQGGAGGTGASGISGSSGHAGDTGASGASGISGSSGQTGAAGASGGEAGGAAGVDQGGQAGAAGQAGSSGQASAGGAQGGQGGQGGQAAGGSGAAGKAGAAGKGGSGGQPGGQAGGGQGGSGGAQGGSGGEGGAGGSGGATGGECPPGMAPVAGEYCVDRWEAQVEVEEGGIWILHSPYETLDDVSGKTRAVSSPGVVPQGYISGLQARAACEGAGKRLCTRAEYRGACRGPEDFIYPYGNDYQEGACNEGREKHPIVELFGPGPGVFNSTNMNDPQVNQLPDSLAPTGAYAQCESPWGAFDMSGNLHEWVDEDDGTFCGGFYVDAKLNGPGCLYTTTAHSIGYHDYSTGFRCCLTP